MYVLTILCFRFGQIRISCTESTLLQSLGLGCEDAAAGLGEGGGSLIRLDGQDKSGQVDCYTCTMCNIRSISFEMVTHTFMYVGDARLLARTWLQDDGQIEEVLEITRFDSVFLLMKLSVW